MDPRRIARAKRAARHARRYGTWRPVCLVCGLSDILARYEHHHIAARFHGRRLSWATVLLCRRCHDRSSDMQQDDPPLPRHLDPAIARWVLSNRGLIHLLELSLNELKSRTEDLAALGAMLPTRAPGDE